MNYRLIIFDVDGTLTTTKSGETFRKSADDWQFLPGRIEKCKQLRAQGVKVAIASNQAGVAFRWSKMTAQDIRHELLAVGIAIDASYVGICCSSPNEKALPEYYNPNDPRRKPNPRMLLEAMERVAVSPEDTLMVGDRPEDEQAAKNAGVAFEWADTFFKVAQEQAITRGLAQTSTRTIPTDPRIVEEWEREHQQ